MHATRTRSAIWATAAAVAVAAMSLWIVPGTSPAAQAQPAMPTMTSMPTGSGDGLLPPGDWTPQQRAYLLDLISRTEAALPAFADPEYLISIGFHNFGADAPGGYVHYINNAWIDDDHILDPTHPESLLFQQTYDPTTHQSRLTLVAAMFILPTGTTMDDIPPDIAWIPGWHVHPDVCVTDDLTFAGLANSDGTCSSGHPMDGPPMTHVWITDNGCGNRFSMVDVGGLMCDLDMDMGPTTTMNMNPDTTMNMGSTSTTVPGSAPSAASPVKANPTYTG